jgi:hypothetical protein
MALRTSIRLAALVLPVALATAACTPARVHPPGALQHVDAGESVPASASSWRTSVPAGTSVAVTLGAFYNVRPYDITIVDVTPIDASGLSVVGVDMAGPGRSGHADGYDAYPPVDPGLGTLAPASGFVIPANEPLTDGGYEFVVGLRADGDARAVVNGFHIVYEANGVRYAYNEPAYVAVCAPPTTTGACTPNHDA